MVSHHTFATELSHQIDTFRRVRTIADNITEKDGPLGTALQHIFQYGLEGDQIRVDVGEQGDFRHVDLCG